MSTSTSTHIAVVTGGAGFIGSHVADRLVADGHTIIVVDDLSSGRRENVPEAATFIEASITDTAAMQAIADEYLPTLWFHLAAQADVRVSVARPVHDAGINVIGTLNVLRAAESTRAPVVFSSTGGAIYGPGSVRPTDESCAAEPLSPYGAAKLAAEAYMAQHARLTGIAHAILRYANVYGPRQDPHGEAGVVAIFGGRALAGEDVTIYGDGEQTRDYVYVADVVDATVAAANVCTVTPAAPSEPEDQAAVTVPIYNVGTGMETSVNELWAVIRDVSGADVSATHADPRPGELRASALDATAARRDLGAALDTPLEMGLAATVGWMRQQMAGTVEA